MLKKLCISLFVEMHRNSDNKKMSKKMVDKIMAYVLILLIELQTRTESENEPPED